jgi:hypothetical protein
MTTSEPAIGLNARTVVILLIGAAILGFVLGFTIFALFARQAWLPGAQVQVFVLLAAGALAGVLATVVFFWLNGRETQTSWVYVALFSVAIMAIAASWSDQISFLHAMLVVLFGSVALLAAANALSLFRQGEAIELETSWGGLGGALGGWRLSPATSLVISAFVFAFGATIASQDWRKDSQVAVAKETKASKDTKATTEETKGGAVMQQTPNQPAAPAAASSPAGAGPSNPAAPAHANP